MSRLSNLFGKTKEYIIGGENFVFEPLSIEHVNLIMELSDKDKQGTAMNKILKMTLKKAVPDATDEEINKISLKHFKEFSEAIADVNGLSSKE